jgi:hypothetical protein
MVEWENPNNFFCMTTVESLDMEFYDHTNDMNYPVCYTLAQRAQGPTGQLATVEIKS